MFTIKFKKKSYFRHYFWFALCLLSCFAANNCKEPVAKKFNHSSTLFPLHGAHMGINCRECHKDGSITSLPVDCQSCHPMTPNHTLNLGDCDMCHTTTTFSAPYFNHNRAGVSITGGHIAVVIKDCQKCHIAGTYSGVNFTCSRCHSPPSYDGVVHKLPPENCEKCHSQASFRPGKFDDHRYYQTKLQGGHAGLECSTCHPGTFSNWKNINYRDGMIYGSCANCHTRSYQPNEHHHGLSADANCAKCHGYNGFHGD